MPKRNMGLCAEAALLELRDRGEHGILSTRAVRPNKLL
jgi:hypothetical protein